MNKDRTAIIRAILIFVMIFSLGTVLGLTAYMLNLKKTPDATIQPEPDTSVNLNPSDNPEIEISNWRIYGNDEYGFEVKFPSDLVLQKNTGETYISFLGKLSGKSYFLNFGYIPQNMIDERGTSYCESYPNDSRCEDFTSNNLRFLIDWNIETEGAFTASKAEISKSGGGKIVISILHSPNQDIKAFFRQILSTFKFIEKDETADWKTYQNKDYGISFKHPSSWLLKKDSADKNLFGMSFSIENINTTLSVVGITNNYVDDGPPGWFGYCAVVYKDVDQFCKEGCIRINDKTATRRGRENHGDAGYSLLAYTNASKNFPSICWELDMGSILSKIADQKGIEYYEVKNEDVEAYIKENDKDENLKDIIQKFEEFSQSIKSF